ncbi:MAG: hypothetical protein ACE5J5_03270 [Candidatus Hydrothermarchaeales archaeon]
MRLLDKKVKDMTIEDFREDRKRMEIQKAKWEKLMRRKTTNLYLTF